MDRSQGHMVPQMIPGYFPQEFVASPSVGGVVYIQNPENTNTYTQQVQTTSFGMLPVGYNNRYPNIVNPSRHLISVPTTFPVPVPIVYPPPPAYMSMKSLNNDIPNQSNVTPLISSESKPDKKSLTPSIVKRGQEEPFIKKEEPVTKPHVGPSCPSIENNSDVKALTQCLAPGCKSIVPLKGQYCKVHRGTMKLSPSRLCQEVELDFCMFHNCERKRHGKSRFCRWHNSSICTVERCSRGAIGKERMYCFHHGGGKRCKVEGCMKHVQRFGLCISHGGCKRCSIADCKKNALGTTGRCEDHGGNKKCSVRNCNKRAQLDKGVCSSHGGGKRCVRDGCHNAARGKDGLCRSHGSGRRMCRVKGCTKGARSSTYFCTAHRRTVMKIEK